MAYYGPQGQPPAPGYGYVPPEPPKRASSKAPCIIVGAIGGCGCLVVIAVAIALHFGILGGLWFWQQQSEPPQPVTPPFEMPPIEQPAPVPVPNPVPVPEPAAPPDQPQPAAPSGAGPSMAAAIQAALDAINEPSWITKIQEHSPDWRSATIWAGPPQSEWVYQVRLEWDDGLRQYVLQEMSEVTYP